MSTAECIMLVLLIVLGCGMSMYYYLYGMTLKDVKRYKLKFEDELDTRKSYQQDAKTYKRRMEDLDERLEYSQREYQALFVDRNRIAEEHNLNVKAYNRLLIQLQEMQRTQHTRGPRGEDGMPTGSPFTPDELKRIRFAMHPDKNQGKTTDLWRKINNMMEK